MFENGRGTVGHGKKKAFRPFCSLKGNNKEPGGEGGKELLKRKKRKPCREKAQNRRAVL